MRMRMAATTLGVLLMVGHAGADVTITATQTGKGMMAGFASGESVTRIKGGRQRVDGAAGDNPTSTLFDLDAQTMTAINHRAREATVTDLRELQGTMRKLTDNNIKTTVTPTNRRREVAGQTCDEYRIDMTMPATVEGGPTMVITTSGPFCVVKDAPGRADYAAFYTKAADQGFIISGDPRQAKAQPGHAKSMSELYRQIARLGVPYAVEMDIKMGGEGPMGALMGKIGGLGFSSTVIRVSDDPISDDVWAVPSGYRVKRN